MNPCFDLNDFRYASLPKEKIEMYRRYVLGSELTAHDFYFAKWIF